jgi:signal transduction histidine kinase
MTREECQFSNEEVEFLSTLAAQAAIAIHNSQIYEQTKKQSQELAKLNVELEKSNKVKDEFLNVMSHELRTPLNVVMGYAGMMKDGLLGEVNPEQAKALEKILSRAGDQINLVESILQATQIEIGTIKVESHEVNLGKFLDDLRFSCEIPFGKEISLYWDFADLPVVETDSAKLRQILRNLFNNAAKFTEKGRVVISARHLPEAKAVQFKVEDTGIGIPEDALPFIFDKFHQVDSSETRLYGGVGMGLYIVKMFTELLGGKVEVESRPGKGSTFTVIVPYEKTAQIRSYVTFQHADLHGAE